MGDIERNITQPKRNGGNGESRVVYAAGLCLLRRSSSGTLELGMQPGQNVAPEYTLQCNSRKLTAVQCCGTFLAI